MSSSTLNTSLWSSSGLPPAPSLIAAPCLSQKWPSGGSHPVRPMQLEVSLLSGSCSPELLGCRQCSLFPLSPSSALLLFSIFFFFNLISLLLCLFLAYISFFSFSVCTFLVHTSSVSSHLWLCLFNHLNTLDACSVPGRMLGGGYIKARKTDPCFHWNYKYAM